MDADDIVTVLLHAAEDGNLQCTMEMLEKLADIEAADTTEVRPIHTATAQGNLENLKSLIARRRNVNAPASFPLNFRKLERGVTPLHVAAEKADPNFSLTLIRAGANVNAKSSSGLSPLHVAAWHGHLSVVKALVCAKANVNAADHKKNTPLIYAVERNSEDVALFLLRKGAVVNARNSDRATPLHFAASNGKFDIAKLLIENKATINARDGEDFTPLHLAIKNRQSAVTQLLINSGADVNAKASTGRTPLHFSAHSGYPAETARRLIARGAHVNAKDITGITPLSLAAAHDFPDIVNILIENKADINVIDVQMWTPLHTAAFKGSFDVVKILLASGAEVDVRSYKQNTPLHFAADYWHVEIVKYLLVKGAEVNARNHKNWTPLHYAVDEGSTAVPLRDTGHLGVQTRLSKLNTVKALIENGADINARGKDGETALHIAVDDDDDLVVRYLLKNGAYYDTLTQPHFGTVDTNVTEIAAEGRNGNVDAIFCVVEKLFQAVKRAKCAEIEKCIREGAPVNSRSIKYGTPLMHASWKGHLSVVKLLLKNGADINLSNSNGITSLHYAAKFGHYEVLCTLLRHGAVYNARTVTGRKTPLHFAQEEGKKEVSETLQLINRIFYGISKQDKAVVKELIELKDKKYPELCALKNCKNINKETLAQIATKAGDKELCKLICGL